MAIITSSGEIDGTNREDTIVGSSGNDTIDAGNGNDLVFGNTGQDALLGGNGNDRLFGGSGNDIIGTLNVDDTFRNSGAGDNGGDTIYGDGFDTYYNSGDAAARSYVALGGDTATLANNSTDDGNDLIYGGTGNDTVYGDNGNNLSGSDYGGNDTVYAGNGNDIVYGEGGDDNLAGERGDDNLYGGAGHDLLVGGLGADTLTGGDGDDYLFGDDDDDSLLGGNGNDQLFGGAGADTLDGGAGNDTIDGGAGFDLISFADATGAVNVTLVQSSSDTTVSAPGLGTDTYSNIEGVIGSNFNDALTGSSLDDILQGGAGNDTLRVTPGADTLDGGEGRDSIDFTQTGIAYTGATAVSVNLATHVADLNRSAAGADTTLVSIETAFGTAGDDVFVGGDSAHGVNSSGLSIVESFRGNAGNDTITGGSGAFGTIADYANNTNLQAVSANLFLGTASDGWGGTDTLVNVDMLYGGAGNDLLVGGSSSRSATGIFYEVFRGNAGNDTLDGGNSHSDGDDASNDRADYANNTSAQAVNVNLGTGIALDGLGGTDTLIDIDQVYGGAGNDTLTGGTGNDDFDGGAGNDTLDGGAGSDMARFQQSTAGAIVNLSAGSITVNSVTVAAGTANDGIGGTDTLINIEDVRGSRFNDTIRGSDEVNTRQFFTGDCRQ